MKMAVAKSQPVGGGGKAFNPYYFKVNPEDTWVGTNGNPCSRSPLTFASTWVALKR